MTTFNIRIIGTGRQAWAHLGSVECAQQGVVRQFLALMIWVRIQFVVLRLSTKGLTEEKMLCLRPYTIIDECDVKIYTEMIKRAREMFELSVVEGPNQLNVVDPSE